MTRISQCRPFEPAGSPGTSQRLQPILVVPDYSAPDSDSGISVNEPMESMGALPAESDARVDGDGEWVRIDSLPTYAVVPSEMPVDTMADAAVTGTSPQAAATWTAPDLIQEVENWLPKWTASCARWIRVLVHQSKQQRWRTIAVVATGIMVAVVVSRQPSPATSEMAPRGVVVNEISESPSSDRIVKSANVPQSGTGERATIDTRPERIAARDIRSAERSPMLRLPPPTTASPVVKSSAPESQTQNSAPKPAPPQTHEPTSSQGASATSSFDRQSSTSPKPAANPAAAATQGTMAVPITRPVNQPVTADPIPGTASRPTGTSIPSNRTSQPVVYEATDPATYKDPLFEVSSISKRMDQTQR